MSLTGAAAEENAAEPLMAALRGLIAGEKDVDARALEAISRDGVGLLRTPNEYFSLPGAPVMDDRLKIGDQVVGGGRRLVKGVVYEVTEVKEDGKFFTLHRAFDRKPVADCEGTSSWFNPKNVLRRGDGQLEMTLLHASVALGCEATVVDSLLKAAPEAAIFIDSFGRSPLTVAVEAMNPTSIIESLCDRVVAFKTSTRRRR